MYDELFRKAEQEERELVEKSRAKADAAFAIYNQNVKAVAHILKGVLGRYGIIASPTINTWRDPNNIAFTLKTDPDGNIATVTRYDTKYYLLYIGIPRVKLGVSAHDSVCVGMNELREGELCEVARVIRGLMQDIVHVEEDKQDFT